MKLTLKQYKYERVEINSKLIELPNEPEYYFQTGIRRSIKVIPVFTTWNKSLNNKDEELYEFHFIMVYQSGKAKIEKVKLSISEIGDKYYIEKDTELSSFVKDWLNGDLQKRTNEQFDADFENCLDTIKESLY